MGLKTWLRRIFYKILLKQDYYFTRLAIHGMKWRGFSKYPIHPKHLFDTKKSEIWVKYFKAGMVFLDVGSGTGSECLNAVKKGARKAIGIEYNSRSLEMARARAKDLSAPCEFIECNLESGSLPMDSASVELINFSNCLEHLHERQKILRELKRVKSADGVIILSVPNCDTPWKKNLRTANLDSRDDIDHKIEYSKADLQAELLGADLKIISPLYTTIPSFPWNGALAASAIISPSLYAWLQDWKRRYVERHPETSMGWILVAK